jgi:hypothetical protein
MDRIDDSSIMGNPFDVTRWRVEQRGDLWVVLDALGNVIAEHATEAEARAWWEDQRAK